MRSSTVVKTFFKFFLPVSLWCFLYRGFFWGKLYVSEDTFAIYAVVKYFLENLRLGVFAHWNPFLHWGMGHICQIGEFNPLWLFTLLLNGLGLDLYHSYVWTLAVFFFLSALGVYCFLRKIIEEEFLCYLGFIVFLFSGIGMTIFAQTGIILIFLPTIWFFYFLADFYQNKSVPSALFLGYTLVLVATTYIPFYFLTSFLCVFLLGLILYPQVISRIIKTLAGFIRREPYIFVLVCFMVLTAVGISFFNWIYLKTDLLVMARPAVMTYQVAKDSGLPISEILRDSSLFSFFIQALRVKVLMYAKEIFSLKDIAFDDQRIFYMPLIAHIVVLGGCITRLNKRIVFWALLCFILFLIAIARLSPVYGFLFKYVPYFHMFRNIFFLSAFIITAYIILMLELLRSLCNEFKAVKVYVLGNKWVLGALIILSLIGPMQVLRDHAEQFNTMEQSDTIISSANVPLDFPVFTYVRPKTDYGKSPPNDIYRIYNMHIITMRDADRFITINYGYPTRWSYALAPVFDKLPKFQEYIKHKFVVYDRFDENMVFDTVELFKEWFAAAAPGTFIDSKSQGIEVTRFNADQVFLITNFESGKFLVYNDSYHPFWQAYVNDRPTQVYRANFAFKGIKVPAGKAHIRFEFKQALGGWAYLTILVFFYLYFVFCVWNLIRWNGRLKV